MGGAPVGADAVDPKASRQSNGSCFHEALDHMVDGLPTARSKSSASNGLRINKAVPCAKSTLFDLIIVMTCDEDDRRVRALEPGAALQIQTIHLWHSDVCNRTARSCQEILTQKVVCKRKYPRREPRELNEACQISRTSNHHPQQL
jgi:hypothetical protein